MPYRGRKPSGLGGREVVGWKGARRASTAARAWAWTRRAIEDGVWMDITARRRDGEKERRREGGTARRGDGGAEGRQDGGSIKQQIRRIKRVSVSTGVKIEEVIERVSR